MPDDQKFMPKYFTEGIVERDIVLNEVLDRLSYHDQERFRHSLLYMLQTVVDNELWKWAVKTTESAIAANDRTAKGEPL